MTDIRDLEMRLHKQAHRLGQIENKVDNLLKMIEDLNAKLSKSIETTPIDRNYRGFK